LSHIKGMLAAPGGADCVVMNKPQFKLLIVLGLIAITATATLWILVGRDGTRHPAEDNHPPVSPDAQIKARAAAGDREAQFALGRWHLDPTGSVRNYTLAAHWLTKAAAGGRAEAQYLMGTLYEAGQGVERSPSNALMWFERAAVQQHAGACYNLGSMYAAGRGVDHDSARAAKYYMQAAELGDALAQFNVAQRYQLGRGVDTNLVESWKWYSLAAKGGVPDAQRVLPAVESHLSRKQLHDARRAVEEFLKRTSNLAPQNSR